MHILKTIFSAFSRRERIVFIGAAILLGASVLTLLFRFVYVKTNVVPARGGEYVEGFVGQPSYVNPVLATGEVDRALVRLLFSNVLSIADSIEPLQDGKQWKVRIKENLAWSDGSPFTSDDIVFTVQTIQHTESRSPLASSFQGVNAARVSDLEVQFTLPSAYAYFEDNLRNLYPVPKHIFSSIPPANWRLADTILQPVASGPYAFDRFEKEANGFITRYRLRVNDRYHMTAPYIETISFAFFSDPNQLVQAFNKGAVDGIASSDPGIVKNVNRSYRTHAYPLPSYYAVFLNQSQSIPLKDAVVRNVLSRIIDREELIDAVFDNHAVPAYGPLPPTSDISHASSSPLSFDDAMRMLDEAGWKVGEDGVREKKVTDGTIRLELTLTAPEIPFILATAEELKARFQHIGAQVSVQPLPVGETMTETVKSRDYQALIFGNVLTMNMDLYPFWHSRERFAPGLNLSLYSNTKVDGFIEAAQKDLVPESRRTKLAEAESIIVNDVPALFLYAPRYLVLTAKDVRGVDPSLIGEPADRFLASPTWYVKTSREVR